MMQATRDSREDIRKPLAVAAVLVAYSNLGAALAWARGWNAELTFRYINPLFLLVLVPYSAKEMGGLKGAGLHKKGWGTSTAWGAPVGVGLASSSIFFFANPLVSDAPLEYKPITDMSRGELALDLMVRVPVSIAFFEELAFRGLLYGMLRRRLPAWKAIGISAAAFGLWHAGVTAISVMQTSVASANRLPGFLQDYVVPLGAVGGVVVTGLAGVAFGMLRERTGNLAGPIVAHWIADGLMIGALWWMSNGGK
ncbi:MAG: CPBP family intramembrane glutamic endopeptidase [Chloroflexia bacterium]